MKRVIVGLLILQVLNPMLSFSADWQPIPETDALFDKSRITTDIDGNYLVWIKMTLPPEITTDNPKRYRNYAETLSLFAIDCKATAYADRIIANYDKNGSVMDTVKHTNKPVPVPPGTVGELIVQEICRLSKSNDK